MATAPHLSAPVSEPLDELGLLIGAVADVHLSQAVSVDVHGEMRGTKRLRELAASGIARETN